jgi:HEAT repeat protein
LADDEEVKALLVKALSDPFWVIRANAIDALVLDKDKEEDKGIIKLIEKLAQTDPRPDVRAAAVEKMGTTIADKSYLPVFKSIIENEKSYRVLNSTLISLQNIDNESALSLAKGLEQSTENPTLLLAVAELYSNSGDKSYATFFENNWKKMNDYSGITFFDNYVGLVLKSKDEGFLLSKVDFMKSIGMDDKNNIWHRYAVAAALRKMAKSILEKDLNAKVKSALKEVVDNEKSQTLKNLYKSW